MHIIAGIIIFGIVIVWIGSLLLDVAHPRDETIRPPGRKTDQTRSSGLDR
jgi:hypothetical protein